MKPIWSEAAGKADAELVCSVIADLQPRVKTLIELAGSADFYFAEKVQYEKEAAQKFLQPAVAVYLKEIVAGLPSLTNFSKEGIEDFLKAFAQKREIKLKVIAQPLRVALTGKTVSPGIDEVMVTLGKNRVEKRIQDAVAYIEAQK
jgi:glutamyl-tRNA synthetase